MKFSDRSTPLGYFNDMPGDTTDTRAGASAPSFAVLVGGIFCNRFNNGASDTIFNTIQIPHGIWNQPGTFIHPHCHFLPSINIPIGATVKWQLEYTIIQVGGIMLPGSVTDTQTYVNTAIVPAFTHIFLEFLDVPIPQPKPMSAIIIERLTRVSSGGGADTFAGDCFLIGMDWHIQSDWPGGTLTEFP